MEKINQKLIEIEHEYQDLQVGIEGYQNKTLTPADLKKKSAKFGIYEQKGQTMMLRLKAVGGELSLKKVRDLSNIMNTYNIPYLHLSTRQNYQLHEVAFDNVTPVVKECNSKEMYFRGGGGNTFRSILVSTYTGVDTSTGFDVMPYAQMVENEVFLMDRAFDFGRKLKIGFTNTTSDEFVIAVQDMGFVAKEINGNRGFKVFVGGGMGRNSKLGQLLFDFLPEKDVLKAVKILIDIFYELGNRENRMQARLRFLVEKMGIESFREEFLKRFNADTTEDSEVNVIDYTEAVGNLKKCELLLSSDDFRVWKDLCVKKTKFKDVVSLVLYVKNGDLKRESFAKLATLLEELNIPMVRATINQNLVLPLIHESALPRVFNFLKEEILEIITESRLISSHIRACVGSQVCPMGIQPSPVIANNIGLALNELVNDFPKHRRLIFKESKNIRISGCPSCCAGIPVAPLGFIGLKKKVDGNLIDCLQVFTGGILTNTVQSLSTEVPNFVLPVEDAPKFVADIFRDYLESLETYDISFSQYMYNRKNSIK